MQNHLRFLGEELIARVLQELTSQPVTEFTVMKEWLMASFGPTLGDLAQQNNDRVSL